MSFEFIGTAAARLIKSGSGTAHTVIVTGQQAGDSVTLYDGTDDAGTMIGLWKTTVAAPDRITAHVPIDRPFTRGLYVVTTGPATVTYS